MHGENPKLKCRTGHFTRVIEGVKTILIHKLFHTTPAQLQRHHNTEWHWKIFLYKNVTDASANACRSLVMRFFLQEVFEIKGFSLSYSTRIG